LQHALSDQHDRRQPTRGDRDDSAERNEQSELKTGGTRDSVGKSEAAGLKWHVGEVARCLVEQGFQIGVLNFLLREFQQFPRTK